VTYSAGTELDITIETVPVDREHSPTGSNCLTSMASPSSRTSRLVEETVQAYRNPLFAIIFVFVFPALGFSSATNAYITPDGNPQGACTSAPNSPAWFNSSSNWGSGGGQIGPGTTVHICGSFATTLTFHGSGSAGAPVILLFESGAKFSAPHWGNGASVINSNGYDWLIVDGGADGVVEATNNGSSPTYATQDDESGVDLGTCNNCIIRGLTVSNMFVKNTSDRQGAGGGLHLIGSNSKIYKNVVHDVDIAVGYNYPGGGTITSGEIYGNVVYHANIAFATGDTGAGATFNGLLIHDNEAYDAANWDDLQTNNFHHNGVIVFVTNNNSRVSGLQIYNNYLHGDMGARETGHIFLDSEGNGAAGSYDGTLIYNNLLADDSSVNTPSNGMIITKANGGSPAVSIYNNTFVYQSSNKGRCVMDQGAVLTGKNSIGVACSMNYYISSGTVSTSDYNDFYLSSGSNVTEGSHSITGNPMLDGAYIPQVGSPAIGAATNLTGLGVNTLDFDRAGTPRPQSGAWDIAAYQSSSVDPPKNLQAAVQ
jgi:hypothetical protein